MQETFIDHNLKNWQILNVIVIALLCVVFGPIPIVGGWIGCKAIEDDDVPKWAIIILIIFGVVWVMVMRPWFWLGFQEGWGRMIGLSTPLVFSAAVLVEPYRRGMMLLKPKSLQEQIEEEQAKLAQQQQRSEQRAAKKGANQTSQAGVPKGWLGVGPFIKGDIIPSHIGVLKNNRWVWLDESLLDQHLFVLGTTGAGKSETIKRLIWEIANKTGRDIFLVDGKGEEGLAQEVRSICHHAGRGDPPIFRMGGGEPGYPYHGFCGDRDAIYNRLAAMVGILEAKDDAAYYARINRNILQLVCQAQAGPPRSFSDLRQRLDKDWLRQAWEHTPEEMDEIDRIPGKQLYDLRSQMVSIARPLSSVVNEAGFVLENTKAAVFSIRMQSVTDIGQQFLKFLIEDIKDFVGKRQQRPGVLIIDEFGAFGNENIIALLTMARSAQMGVILATQDIASLSDENITKLVLANTRTKILMATDFPEDIAQLAGTKYQVEASVQHNEGEPTGMGSARIQHTFKVDMNEAAQLKAGQAFIIRQRHQCKVQVARVEDVPAAPPEQLPNPPDITAQQESSAPKRERPNLKL